jgi:hypothetical protein
MPAMRKKDRSGPGMTTVSTGGPGAGAVCPELRAGTGPVAANAGDTELIWKNPEMITTERKRGHFTSHRRSTARARAPVVLPSLYLLCWIANQDFYLSGPTSTTV